MSNEEILDMLAEAECELYHKATDNPKNEELKAAHAGAKQALVAFAKAIGYHG